MWDTHSIISATAGVICLVVGLAMWFLAPAKDRNTSWHDPAVLVLVFAGGCGIKNTKAGGWVNWCIDKLTGWIGSLAITIGVGVGLGIIAFVLVYGIVQRMRETGVQPIMLVGAFLVPFVVGAIPGTVGLIITTVLGWIAAAPAWAIAAGFGIN